MKSGKQYTVNKKFIRCCVRLAIPYYYNYYCSSFATRQKQATFSHTAARDFQIAAFRPNLAHLHNDLGSCCRKVFWTSATDLRAISLCMIPSILNIEKSLNPIEGHNLNNAKILVEGRSKRGLGGHLHHLSPTMHCDISVYQASSVIGLVALNNPRSRTFRNE